MLKHIFNPKSIAVVGVSSNPAKLGSVIYNNIIVSGYRGNVYPVNPKYSEIFGRKCFGSIEQIPGELEQAIFIVPAESILEELEIAGRTKHIKSAVIITAGFKETGEEGALREAKVLEIAQKYNIRILGPNCLGYINPEVDLNASFAGSNPDYGNIYFISQSGAFCTAILDIAVQNNLGFHNFVSFGNKLDVNEIELTIEALKCKDVDVIGLYIEEISDGLTLSDLIKTNRSKPIVILNPGKTEQAQSAIASHTGSLAGSSKLREQALKQSGAVLVDRMEEMYNMLMGFAWSKRITGNRVAIITNAGGPGIIATDHLIENGMVLAEISEETKADLRKKLPPTASVKNPIDVIGDALADRYEGVMRTLSNDPNVDIILVILTPQVVTQIEETAKLIISESKICDKPIFVSFIGGKYACAGLERFYDNRIPAFVYVETAIDTITKMYQFYKYNEDYYKLNGKIETIQKSVKRKSPISKVINNCIEEGITTLPESSVHELCKEFDIDTPKQLVTSDINEINKFLIQHKKIVMKASTSDLVHKTEFKGVYLDITNHDEAGFAYYQLQKCISEAKNEELKKMYNLLIQEQFCDKSEELFIGISRDGSSKVYESDKDKGFGHQILFGKGGIYAEIYKDINLRLLPLSRAGFAELISSTKVSSILYGARTGNKLAVSKLISLFENLQLIVFTYPEIVSIDINPVFLSSKRAVVVDMKVFVSK